MLFRSFAWLLVLTAGCSQSSAPSSSPSPDAGGGADAPTAETGTVAPTRTYVGRVQDGTDGGTLVALATTGDHTLLFFCSTGATLSELTHWMRADGGALTIGQPFALGDGVASASGTADATGASGTLVVGDAASLPWTASLVGDDAGVQGLWAATVGDAGTADLIVVDPDVAAGALRPGSLDQVLQVTPLDTPVDLTGDGIQVQVTVQGVTQTVLLARVTAASL